MREARASSNDGGTKRPELGKATEVGQLWSLARVERRKPRTEKSRQEGGRASSKRESTLVNRRCPRWPSTGRKSSAQRDGRREIAARGSENCGGQGPAWEITHVERPDTLRSVILEVVSATQYGLVTL